MNTPSKTPTRTRNTTNHIEDRLNRYRAKRLRFLINGDKLFSGITYALNTERTRSYDALLNELTSSLSLNHLKVCKGVRYIFRIDGSLIKELQDFQDGQTYICSSIETFTPIKYKTDWLVRNSACISSSRKTPIVRRTPQSATNYHPHHRETSHNNNGNHNQHHNNIGPTPNHKLTTNNNIRSKDPLHEYEIGRPIGDGHFSVVYCCMNKTTKEFCALKLIDKLKCKGRDDMIYNEVKILKRLNHPNIVKLKEEFDQPKKLYLILELVQDGDLFDAISNVTKFSEVHVATMIHNLSSALTYLHKQGIVHRDIKPENLLISVQEDGSQSVKLADFGLAVELGDSPLYSVCGTAFYVSPEMLNETGYDFKVDVWSTGVICFILLCGYPPFTSENENNQDELFDAILAGDFQFAPPYWNSISHQAKNLIRCMLTVDPEIRYTAEQVFEHPWTMGTSSNFDGINPMNLSREIALQSHI